MKIHTTRLPGSADPVLRFAVVADTHVNESEQGGSSPFVTNSSANARARYVFNEIALMDPAPDFVVHLGDIVHPVPSLPGFQEAVSHFKAMTSGLAMPLHVIPGNHDVGDKRIDWMPADLICTEYLDTYREAFGPDYFAFDSSGCRFLMLNSVLFNSDLPQDQAQRDWLVSQLDEAAAKRVFVFMHYPPYIHTPDEPGNYDNIDQPARAWLVQQLQRESVEAVFAGHVHNFWYDHIGHAEMYMLPSTAFMRHDFSEFYRVAPRTEHARGDAERYGYFLVEVFDNGHVAYSLRTMDRRAAPGEAASAPTAVAVAHPKTSGLHRVGVELRHPWAETMQISATGGVQEFGRKWARNDYPLQALWEMGVRCCKIPSLDLAEDYSADRMAVLATNGNRFIVTCLGVPRDALLKRNLDACGVDAFEVNATAARFDSMKPALKRVREQTGRKVLFAQILSGDSSRFDGKHFTHFVKSGLTTAELDDAAAMVRAATDEGAIDGVTIRIDFNESLPGAIARVHRFADTVGCEVLVSLKTAGESVAGMRADDAALAVRAAQAMLLSQTHDRVSLVFDSFMDVDRGYYPRQAFIDRRFNPRLPAQAMMRLNASLSPLGQVAWNRAEGVDSAALQVINAGGVLLAAGRAAKVNGFISQHATRQGWDLLSGENGDAQTLAAQPVVNAADCLRPEETFNPGGLKLVLLTA